jgi:hypothetical protein
MLQIEKPLKTFYKRCLLDYHIGDTSHYTEALKSVEKDCYNPFIATEWDIQVKLGGIIDAYLINEQLPFSVNAEMKIYGDAKQMADLSIHRVFSETLYLENKSCKENLECVIEVKYANAKNPKFDFKNNKIFDDLWKLSSLDQTIEKVFVFIDEADNTPSDKLDKLISECQDKRIRLFSTNNYINYKLNYPYGYNNMFWLSKKKNLNDKDYIFGKKEEFLKTVYDCFNPKMIMDETIEINFNDIKIVIYYSDEFSSKDEIKGHILIETFSNTPISIKTINKLFQNFSKRNQSFLFLVKDKSEVLVIG